MAASNAVPTERPGDDAVWQAELVFGEGDYPALRDGALTAGWTPFAHVHPEDAPALRQGLAELERGACERLSLVYRLAAPGESLRWLQLVVRTVKVGAAERMFQAAWVCRTEQLRSERLARLQSEIIAAIARGTPLAEILTALCRGLEALYDRAWISVMQADAARGCLDPLASGSIPPEFSAQLIGLPIHPLAGACGAAAATRERVIAPDVQSDARFTPYLPLLNAYSLRSIWSEPVLAADGRLLGTLAVYRHEIHQPSPAELQLIAAGARLAALAWQNWEQIQRLRDREDRFRALVEQAHMIPWEADLASDRYTYVGPQAATLGYPPEAWLEPHFWQRIIHSEDRERVLQTSADGVRWLPNYEVEYRLLAADGRAVWVQDLVQVVREQGAPVRLRGYLLEISARKAAEAAQRKSEAFLDAALASLPMRVWATALNGDILLQNPVSVREFGELCGKNTWRLPISPEFLRDFRPLFDRAARGETAAAEIQHTVFAQPRYERFTVAPVVVDSQIVAVLGCDIDLTSLRTIQDQLQESENRSRTIAQSAPDLILQVGRDFRIRYINHLAPEQSPGDVLGTNALDWVPPASRAMVEERVLRVFAEGVSQSYEVGGPPSLSVADHWFEVRVSPVKVHDEVVSCIMIARDVTAQRDARIALEESEARYRLVAEHSADMIYRVGVDGRVLYASPASIQVFKRRPEDVVGRNGFENILAEDRPDVLTAFARLLQGEPSMVVTFRAKVEGGGVVWVEAHGAPIKHSVTGAVVEVVAVARDITARVQAEERQRRHQSDLAHVERLSALGQMASELAHELNQPLAAIANYSQACLNRLRKDGMGALAESLDWLEKIDRQARRAGAVIRRVIQFVRKGELDREAFDLNECVRGLETLFDLALHRRDTRIDFDLTVAELPVYADRLLIEQVLLNLVRNAADAMEELPREQRVIRLRTEILPEAKALVRVTDCGPGIAEENLPRLFEPYFTTKVDGTGLGLAICKSTIEAHGGRISAHNEPSGGAALSCELPLEQQGCQ